MKSTRLDGVLTWSRFQPDRRIDFSGFALVGRPGGNVLVDPMPLDETGWRVLDEHGGAAWIVLTNADHLRATPEIAERTGARVCAPASERGRFGDAAGLVGHWFDATAGGPLPEEGGPGLRVHGVRGGKSPVEAVLHLEAQRALVFGDVVRSHESGTLRLLPPEKLADPAAVRADLQPLLDLDFDAVLLGDGDSLWRGGREALAEMLQMQPGHAGG